MIPRRFEEYEKEGVVRKRTPNPERAKSLILEAQRKLESLKIRLAKISVEDSNANDYVESCYDVIMFLIRSKMYFKGYSSSGQRAHESEVSYLRVLKFDEDDVRFADRLRYFRNGILYYGTRLDGEYALKVLEFMEKVYSKLK